MVRRVILVLFIGIFYVIWVCGCQSRSNLDVDEETTESLADSLSDWAWSIRDGDQSAIKALLAEQLSSSPWPSLLTMKSESELISEAELSVEPEKQITSKDWLAELETYLDGFSTLEDVQIKLIDSELGFATNIRIKWSMKLVGRDREKRRLWIRLKGTAQAARVESGWKLGQWIMESATQTVAHKDLFSEISQACGLRQPFLGKGRLETSGHPGACAGDLNNDGWLDILASDFHGLSCYLNQGDGTFENKGSVLFPTDWGERFQQAPLLVDMDNDGDLDLFVSGKKYDPTRKTWVNSGGLYRNLLTESGELRFRNVTERLGKEAERLGGYSVASCDLNGDKLPDFFVANWQDYDGKPLLYLSSGAAEFGNSTNGATNLLFISEADGSYRERAEEWGVGGSDWSFVGSFCDLDEDGDQDLLVSNDYGPNRFYLNQGGSFEERGEERGASRGGFGMGLSFADFDNDGLIDVHSTNMSSVQSDRIAAKIERGVPLTRKLMEDWKDRLGTNQGNRLLKNLGQGQFGDVTASHGPFLGGWGFGGGFIDVDNDGFVDLYAPNGRVSGQNAHDT